MKMFTENNLKRFWIGSVEDLDSCDSRLQENVGKNDSPLQPWNKKSYFHPGIRT